jgi:Flp pilus assembly protein TadD
VVYRWERATQLDPTYAAAYNNLAVAYEHEGRLDKARSAYEKALELDPDNVMIRQNFDLFKEINDRAAKKDGR